MTTEDPSAPQTAGPLGPSPARRPGSVRRTSTLDTRWPGGFGTGLHIDGRARDLYTPADGRPPLVLAEDRLRVRFTPASRVIGGIESTPARNELALLAGARCGGGFRALLAQSLPRERDTGTPLYLMLDDLAAVSLIADFAVTRWPSAEPGAPRTTVDPPEGVCTGFMPGSSALNPDRFRAGGDRTRRVVPLPHPDDPEGWHELTAPTEPSMRRARRIDVTPGEVIDVDAMFQDSATVPQGGRSAVHEYRLHATAHARTGALLTLRAEPRILPYDECPLAVLNLDRLLGTPLADLRTTVPKVLRGIDGCTHLNDALRALAEVPALMAAQHRRARE
ncbi:DUF2889 domain-containing protein [Streptomyces viridosporus]|uniref:DUF2889 domain-containing protein n=1 Tax=Streptomyces viridosporus TaxID=67581 RepID=UPI0036F7E03A